MYRFPYVLHGLCEDYLTYDIAFNAVMPLSRASTRGRYSRIEGITTLLTTKTPNFHHRRRVWVFTKIIASYILQVVSLHEITRQSIVDKTYNCYSLGTLCMIVLCRHYMTSLKGNPFWATMSSDFICSLKFGKIT